ncbi:tetratricopeptide repeat protein [Diaphorobacter sp.]|uniref:tetratricopeptide repeat protein n=1 Tax=Diaphorobacter sp. TaxID=1934310 RepID=UPI003D105928
MTPARRPAFRCLHLLAATVALLAASWAQADEYADIARLIQQGKPAEAAAQLDQRLTTAPRDPQLRFLRGVALTDSGKHAEAIEVFTKLTEEYPELPEPYNNLAVLYASQNQLEKARTALEMAVRTKPDYATAHENLGDIHAKLAGQSYLRAQQLDKAVATSVAPKLKLLRELFAATAKPAAPKAAAPASR